MNEADDTDIDALLRDQFDGPVADDGFVERVMRQPRPRRRRVAWPLGVGIVAGVAACWLSLLPASLLRVGWQAWVHGQASPSAFILLAALGGMALLACWWTAMEPEGP